MLADNLPAPDDVYDTDEPPLPKITARPHAADNDNEYAPPKAEIKRPKSKRRKEYSRDNDELSGLDTVICILCPGIACIASIVYMLQGKGKALKVFLLSIAGNILWFLIRLALQFMAQQPGGGP